MSRHAVLPRTNIRDWAVWRNVRMRRAYPEVALRERRTVDSQIPAHRPCSGAECACGTLGVADIAARGPIHVSAEPGSRVDPRWWGWEAQVRNDDPSDFANGMVSLSLRSPDARWIGRNWPAAEMSTPEAIADGFEVLRSECGA